MTHASGYYLLMLAFAAIMAYIEECVMSAHAQDRGFLAPGVQTLFGTPQSPKKICNSQKFAKSLKLFTRGDQTTVRPDQLLVLSLGLGLVGPGLGLVGHGLCLVGLWPH